MFPAKTKWRIKLQKSFEGKSEHRIYLYRDWDQIIDVVHSDVDSSTRAGKWVLFSLPLITVLREG